MKNLPLLLPGIFFNLQSKARAHIVAKRHYHLDNDLFLSFLDAYNQYSCACFEGAADLNQAQQKKLDLICRKTALVRTDHVLDIGLRMGRVCEIRRCEYYLLSCAGAFRARSNQVWQIVLTKYGTCQPTCRF